MAARRKIDLELAASGYLREPSGKVRRIAGLEKPASDALRNGVRAYWGSLELRGDGNAYVWSNVIVLSPALLDQDASRIAEVFAHEVAHCCVGTSHKRALAWQRSRYGERDF